MALIDIKDPVTASIGLVENVVNKIWPDKSEQERMQMAGALALLQGQMEINKAEASSSSAFTSGWRPAIGWVCGAALAYTYLAYPLLVWATVVWWPGIKPPVLGNDEMLYQLLLGMLGMSGLRSFDKSRGTAS